MATYTSTQSGNFNSAATWGGGGWPNLDADIFTVNAGHTVTYNLTTPLNIGLGSSTVNAGGTFIFDTNSQIRFDGVSTYLFACNGNFFCKPGVKIFLKGTTAADKAFDIRSYTQNTTTATAGVSGQNTVTVASAANIIVGNKISGTGIGSNAIVTVIAGNILTLSVNNTATVTGTITIGNTVEIIGSEGMPITNVTAAVNAISGYQQGFISVASSAEFAIEDWISAHERGLSDVLVDRNDEGFIIHDISGNDIYIREFVGPTATITAVNSNIITVNNANKFRTYQKLIFGVGANRNVASITSIDTVANTITLGSVVAGSVVGETVYTTGPIQNKKVNDKVRKVATTVVTEATAAATQFVLGSTAGFTVGDEILIDSRWTTDLNYTDERPEKRNITAINGNIITLNAAIGYIAVAGSFVVKLTRDIKIIGDYETTLTLTTAQSFAAGDIITQAFSGARGVVKTATTNSTTVVIQDIFGNFITGTANSPWLSKNGVAILTNVSLTTVTISTVQGHAAFGLNRGGALTTNNLPSLQMRDVELTTFSNQNSTSSRVWLRGQWSSPFQANGGVEFEGITWATPSQTDNFNYSTRRFQLQRYWNDATFRCGVMYNTEGGLGVEEGYNVTNFGIYNNYSCRAETYAYILQHGTGAAWEFAYNYINRADDVGFYFIVNRYSGRGIHHNWCNMSQGRAVQSDTSYGAAYILFQNKFEGYFNPTAPLCGRSMMYQYNEFITVANQFDFIADTSFQQHNFSVNADMVIYSLEHNYELGAVTAYIPNGTRVWNAVEQSWRCTFDDDTSLECGFDESVWIPANTAVTVKGTIKLNPTYNGTAPKLELLDAIDRYYFGGNQSILSSNYPLYGNRVNVNFDILNLTGYQSVTLTSPEKPFGRYVTIGVICSNANASEGWWEKPIEVVFSALPNTGELDAGTRARSVSLSYMSDAVFNEKKIRIAGRLN